MKNHAQFDFKDARVVVTGGTSGLGYGIAKAFAASGAHVIITGTRDSLAKYDLSGHDAVTGGFTYRQLKLNAESDILAFAERVQGVDILVNNAGDTLPGASFTESVQVNLQAVYTLSQALHEKLKQSQLVGGASVVNLGSMMSFFGSPYFPGYGAAKAGVVQLTKTLAAGWAADNIRVNAVAPGSVPTRMTEKYAADPAIAEMVNAKTPMRRWGTPEEIARAVQFVCSDAATFITGHTLIVDGGYSIID